MRSHTENLVRGDELHGRDLKPLVWVRILLGPSLQHPITVAWLQAVGGADVLLTSLWDPTGCCVKNSFMLGFIYLCMHVLMMKPLVVVLVLVPLVIVRGRIHIDGRKVGLTNLSNNANGL